MEVQELRIGNLVTTVEGTKHFGKELEIEFLTNNNCYDLDAPLDSINGYELNKVIPIPLTEEWIVRFGFASYKLSGFNYFGNSKIKIAHTFDNRNIFFEVNASLAPLEYVHQLQNLYFALTGEELTLTNEK